jgi:formylglycine-generating enzyme required for sulfatase activity
MKDKRNNRMGLVASTELTTRQRQRLQKKLASLQQPRDLLIEKISRLRTAQVIETSVTVKFQLEQQLLNDEAELARLDDEIERVEQELQNGEMGNDTSDYNLKAIHQLLLEAFTPEELRRFCRDLPTFRPVTKRFGPGQGLDDMADELITYCDTRLLFPELLAALKQHNPRQYARFIEPQPSKDQPAPSAPELALSASDRDLLTMTNPIRLDLVRVPAGEFQMGSVMARDEHAQDDELPPHPVHVAEFYIGKYPVTNVQYRAFVQATGHRAPDHWEEGRIPSGKSNHPVIWVTWHDAVAFCDWLSRETGQPFRLPTEAEWEKAARGADGRIFPWGDAPPDESLCNFNRNVGDTTAIGRYSPQGDSPYGCAGMAGNVWEWCQSLYRSYPYQAGDGREDRQLEDYRVLRGGSWYSEPQHVRCAARNYHSPDTGGINYGFRVARGPLG